MKKLILLFLGILAISITRAQQSNLVFFSENGEHFSVVLNGMLQNDRPETNIKVTDLPAPSYKVKIIFDQPKLADINKTIFMNPGTETTYNVKYLKKKGYVLRMMNTYPVIQDPETVEGQMVVGYQPKGVTAGVASGTTIVNNTTINNNVSISANGKGNNVNVVNSNDGAGSQQAGSLTGINTGQLANPDKYILPGYNGTYGCPRPMSPVDFDQAKASISSKNFEDSKLTIAKQIIQGNCLLSSQVREMLELFSFEDTRLNFAKFAYAYTLDLGNYYKVNDAFKFELSIDELNKFIQGNKR